MTAHQDPPLPLPRETWDRIARELDLSDQHKRIIEMILKNRCDKQIVTQTQRSKATIRAHIGRIFQYLGVDGRLDLVLLIFPLSHGIHRPQRGRHM